MLDWRDFERGSVRAVGIVGCGNCGIRGVRDSSVRWRRPYSDALAKVLTSARYVMCTLACTDSEPVMMVVAKG